MELELLFEKWKLNHNHFAGLLGMPKGTFNNKLNPNHYASFKNDELNDLKGYCREMVKDLKSFINTYLEGEEDLTGPVDEVIYYSGKPVN
jgi:hypothetical protein